MTTGLVTERLQDEGIGGAVCHSSVQSTEAHIAAVDTRQGGKVGMFESRGLRRVYVTK